VTSLFKLKIKTVSRQGAKSPRKSILFVFLRFTLCVLRAFACHCFSNLKSKPFHAKTQRRQENLFFLFFFGSPFASFAPLRDIAFQT